MNCIFCKIASHEISKEFTYEDSEIMVFPDIHPVRPVHLLVMPKKHIGDFLELVDGDLFNKLREVIQAMISKTGLSKKGYRLTVHGGGAQIIDHLHIHLMGPMGKAAKL